MLFWHLGMTALVVFVTLGRRRIDFRVVLLGSILPDIIDKPIGRIFFAEELQNSRLIGHALIFWVIVLLGIQLFLRGDTARRWFILPIAAMLHLGLDAMWNQPITLLWPLFGLEFPKDPVADYWWEVLTRIFEHPVEGLKELMGISALVYMGWAYELFQAGNFKRFLRTGRLEERRAIRSR